MGWYLRDNFPMCLAFVLHIVNLHMIARCVCSNSGSSSLFYIADRLSKVRL